MEKITIKHYLNTKAKPKIIFGNIEAYPLYLQIIHKRTNYKIRSLFFADMSIKAFEELKKGGNYLKETAYFFNFNFTIKDEPKILDYAIRYLDENGIKYKISNIYFRKYIEEITNYAFVVYSKAAAEMRIFDGNIRYLIDCFKFEDRTLLDIADFIEEIAGIDILKYLPKECIEIWKVVQTTKQKSENYPNIIFKTYIEYWNENKKNQNDIIKRLDKKIAIEKIGVLFN